MDPVWTAAISEAAAIAKRTPQRHAVPITPTQVTSIIRTAPAEVAAVVAIAWATAGRLGDVCRLKKMDVRMEGEEVDFFFRIHKTIKKRGPYTISTRLGGEGTRLLQQALTTGTSPHLSSKTAQRATAKILKG